MAVSLIAIRSKQIFRSTQGIGFFRLTILFVTILVSLFALFKLSAIRESAILTSVFVLLAMGTIHYKRPDRLFLQINFKDFKNIYAFEYLLFTTPFVFGLLLHNQWIVLLPFLVGLLIISRISPNTKFWFTINSPIHSLIPPTSFEWKSGVRQTIYLIIPLWLLGVFTSFLICSVPIVMLLLAIVVTSFYEKSEPLQMILALQRSSKQFVYLKIAQGLFQFSALTMPLMLLFVIFHVQYWYVPLILYIILATNLIYIILVKYAYYHAQKPSNTMNAWNIVIALMAIPLLTPVLLPVSWILSIRFYKKSIANLNPYLNDFN